MSEPQIPFPSSVQVPREAYRWWPSAEDTHRGKEKKSVRFVFEYQSLTDFEKEKLTRLLKEIKNGMIEGLKIPEDWSQNHLLRFCYGTGWKTRNAVKTLVSHLQWKNSCLKHGFTSLYPKVLKLLVRPI